MSGSDLGTLLWMKDAQDYMVHFQGFDHLGWGDKSWACHEKIMKNR